MTSLSEVLEKMAPCISRLSRSSLALVRLPLWATAMPPLMWRMTIGWAFSRERPPVVP